jgi:hypothetical protein
MTIMMMKMMIWKMAVSLTTMKQRDAPFIQFIEKHGPLHAVAYRRGCLGCSTPPPQKKNSEVLTKLSRIPSYVENTSVTT